MRLLKFILIFSGIAIYALSCTQEKDELLECDPTFSYFKYVYDATLTSGHSDEVTMDTEVHEYTFNLSNPQELCMIGYQSVSGMESTPYLMQIIDLSTNSFIYGDSKTFSSTETSYILPAAPVYFQAGVDYTIRRTQTNWGTNIGNTIGRVARKDSMDFPYSLNGMTITTANFYQNGGPSLDFAVPFIDLIFK